MKKLVKKVTRKMLMMGLVLTVVLSVCVISHAAKSASGSFKCGGCYVGYNDAMTTSRVTARTGFTENVTGPRTGVNINTIIKKTDGTGKTQAGTPVHHENGKTIDGLYSCPSGYKVLSASIKHTAQVNGDTASKSVSLN